MSRFGKLKAMNEKISFCFLPFPPPPFGSGYSGIAFQRNKKLEQQTNHTPVFSFKSLSILLGLLLLISRLLLLLYPRSKLLYSYYGFPAQEREQLKSLTWGLMETYLSLLVQKDAIFWKKRSLDAWGKETLVAWGRNWRFNLLSAWYFLPRRCQVGWERTVGQIGGRIRDLRYRGTGWSTNKKCIFR